MSAGNEPGGIDDLPRVIPIFPLPGVMLLPARGGCRSTSSSSATWQMTQDAMASHRMIGMMQAGRPEGQAQRARGFIPSVCAGRITSFSETPDNRFLLTLNGVCRFAIARELEADGLLYRRVSADYSRFAGDLPEPAPLTVDRGRLIPALRSYFNHNGLTAGLGTRSTGPTTRPWSHASRWPAPSSRARSRRCSNARARANAWP